ncbi:putative zinc-binding metallopeptidase [Candidatus Peregrinibacteria bacterium]|nr:putative zinc-binding metallopeptidase [Candidatus Peregrinibacteria bacterium]
MRFKVFTLFLAIQALSFAIWQMNSAETQVMAAEPTPEVHSAPTETLVDIDFSMRNFNESVIELNQAQRDTITEALKHLPEGHVSSVEKIVLDYDKTAGRGLGGNNLIILRGVNMGFEEMVGVLVHETGHNVDYAYLAPEKEEVESTFMDGSYPLYITDPSIDFYQISWESDTKMKKTASNMDFVSGYAMSDPFEDFAETYTYYVLHNEDFKALSASSPSLEAKYRFMKYNVFNGQEFNTGKSEVSLNTRPWDTTVLSYSLSDFLG